MNLLKKIFLYVSFLFLVVILFTSTILPAGSPVDFFGAKVYGSGSSAYNVMKAGDFNGDGKIDAVISNRYSMTVYYGLGNGEFAVPAVLVLQFSNGPLFPVTGDFNNDGRSDIAVSDRSFPGNNTFAIFLGKADKTFSPPLFSNTDPIPRWMRAVDFDHDGNLDIVAGAADSLTNAIVFYKGNGDGSITFGDKISVYYDVLPHTFDFNNDGLTDILFSDNVGHKVLLNTGNGRFGTPAAINIHPDVSIQGVGDFNNDGIKDVVSVDGGYINPWITIWKGTGNLNFTEAQDVQVSSRESIYLQEIADIDNNQTQDLIFNSLNRTLVRKGLGDGTFSEPVIYGEGGNGNQFVRDVNSDGFLDIVAAQPTQFAVQGSGSISVMLNLGDGDFKSAPVLETGTGTKDITIRDLNGDQLEDFVIVNRGAGGGPGEVVIVTQTTGSNFTESNAKSTKTESSGGSGIDAYAVATGDFNQDNKVDIIVVGRSAYSAGHNALLLINRSNSFSDYFFQIGTNDIYDVAAGDFNSDGKLDLVTTGYQGVSVSFGNGNGTFGTPAVYLNETPSSQIAVADFNNDAKADIAVTNYSIGKIAILINNGSGIFTNNYNHSAPNGPSAVAAADMNGDGNTDLVVSKFEGVSVSMGRGDGTFNNQTTFPVTPGTAANLSVADFDGDGSFDVALLAGTNTISILLNNGNGVLGRETLWSGGVELFAIAAGDLNKDKKPDLIVGYTTSSDGYIKVLFNITENQPQTRKTLFDYDGDAKADISIFRPSSGVWAIQNSSNNSFNILQFGLGEDLVTPADYDGDGKTDISVFRPSTGSWYRLNSTDGSFSAVTFGTNGDIPVPADYDGDGKADSAVFRPSDGTWYLLRSTSGFSATRFGTGEDKPTIGDFDGDGKADIAVFRPSTGSWYRINSGNEQFLAIQFGAAEDKPVPADFDGDGRADIAVFRPSNGAWYRLNSIDGSFGAVTFGTAEDKPVPADFDGDGRADFAVYRPSDANWYLLRSTQGFTAVRFGVSEDIPTPNSFIR